MQDVPIPAKLAYRPIQDNGFLLPWFVKVQKGEPVDFRVTDNQRVLQAIGQNRCWVCGDTLGVHKVFVIGPMCTVNRVSSEPPSHSVCARYSVKVCPFLSNPAMRRSPRDLPTNHVDPPGFAITRNPGVVALWFVKSYKTFKVDRGLLFNIGEPEQVEWWCRGRQAERQEVLKSIKLGMPELERLAKLEGPSAVQELQAYYDRAMKYIPE